MKLLSKFRLENGVITNSENIESITFLSNTEMLVTASDTFRVIDPDCDFLHYSNRVQSNSNIANTGPNNLHPRTEDLGVLSDTYSIKAINEEFSTRTLSNDIFCESVVFSQTQENVDTTDFLTFNMTDNVITAKSSMFGNVNIDYTDLTNLIVTIDLEKAIGTKIPVFGMTGPNWGSFFKDITYSSNQIVLTVAIANGGEVLTPNDTVQKKSFNLKLY